MPTHGSRQETRPAETKEAKTSKSGKVSGSIKSTNAHIENEKTRARSQSNSERHGGVPCQLMAAAKKHGQLKQKEAKTSKSGQVSGSMKTASDHIENEKTRRRSQSNDERHSGVQYCGDGGATSQKKKKKKKKKKPGTWEHKNGRRVHEE